MSRARATLYGLIAVFGIPLLGLFWLISVIPSIVWASILFCAVASLLTFLIWFTVTPGGRAAGAELSRKVRVRSLQHEVSRFKSEIHATQSSISEAGGVWHFGSRIHEIPPLERKLAEQQRELAKARQELNKLWRHSDGWLEG